MSPPRVCILTAGRGTRMGESLAWINKALLPLEDKAIISHIIDACPQGTEFVIGLGHHAEQVRGYLALAHPGTVFHFVDVDPWTGPGSGPGRSLWCCREALGEPFCFVPCDLLPDGPIDTSRPGSWVGVSEVPADESPRYCNFRVVDGRVAEIADKRRVEGENWRAFTGLMRVEHADAFWSAIEHGEAVAGELQVSSGLAALQSLGVLEAAEHPWTDVGEEPGYRAEIVRRHGFDFSKPGEALYILNDRVIKLFASADQAVKRVDRGRSAPNAFPAMLGAPPGFVAYAFVDGRTLYSCVTEDRVRDLLAWCGRELWAPASIDPGTFTTACDGFYRVKTLERVKQLGAMGGLGDEPTHVMGRPVPAVRELLDWLDWDTLARHGHPVRFHGDLQFDNVLLRTDGGFTLLDWRQDFAGRTDAGDLDYDLAKMLGGVRIDYARVKRGEIAYERRGDNAVLDLPACEHEALLSEVILEHAAAIGRDPARIRLLTALIHLNMAPLHAEPFASALRDLARLELAGELAAA